MTLFLFTLVHLLPTTAFRYWVKLITASVYVSMLTFLSIYLIILLNERQNVNYTPDKHTLEADIRENFVRHKPDSPDTNADFFGFRIKVLTLNRAESLQRLLKSLSGAKYAVENSGKTWTVELVISVDVNESGQVDPHVLGLANNFTWDYGKKVVKVQPEQKGIIGQWIDTEDISSEPRDEMEVNKTKECLAKDSHILNSPLYIYANGSLDIFPFHDRKYEGKRRRRIFTLFLEDDMEVSKHYLEWLSSVIRKYHTYPQIGGYTLARAQLKLGQIDYRQPWDDGREQPKPYFTYKLFKNATTKKGFLWVDRDGPLIPPWCKIYLYRLVASWAFVPDPEVWRAFVTWYNRAAANSSFEPLVKGLVITEWYLAFKNQGRTKAMWTQWFVYYCWELAKLERKIPNAFGRSLRYVPTFDLFIFYTNFPDFLALAVNWRQPGAHYNAYFGPDSVLLVDWDGSFEQLIPVGDMFRLGFDGNPEN